MKRMTSILLIVVGACHFLLRAVYGEGNIPAPAMSLVTSATFVIGGLGLYEIGGKRGLLTAALWAVCLTPLWGAIYANPATFWQTFSVGCVQVPLGLLAVGVTILIYDTN